VLGGSLPRQFTPSNLPAPSQKWGREIEGEIILMRAALNRLDQSSRNQRSGVNSYVTATQRGSKALTRAGIAALIETLEGITSKEW
jgi:hypothetical protein